VEQLSKDSDRMTYLTAEEAKEYGLIDRVLTSQKELPTGLPATPGINAGISPGNPGIS
jgi:ATP-dependent Clp protease protease subunit